MRCPLLRTVVGRDFAFQVVRAVPSPFRDKLMSTAHALVLTPFTAVTLLIAASPGSAQGACPEVVLRSSPYPRHGPLLRTPLGAPVVGGDFAFRVERARPNTRGLLAFRTPRPELAPLSTPVLLRLLDAHPSPLSVRFFGTNGVGDSALLFHETEVPIDLCGLDLVFQAFLHDPSVKHGLAPTNAVQVGVGEVNAPLFPGEPTNFFYPTTTPFVVDGFEAGDVNVDTFFDVVIVRRKNSNLLLDVWLSDGAGNLTSIGSSTVVPQSFLVLGPYPITLALADLDDNGALDAVLARAGDDDVLVCMGDGAGGFATGVPYSAGLGPTGLSFGRIDGDPFLDVLVANSRDLTVSVLLGDGSGGFGAASHFFAGATATGGGTFDAELADMDGDGDLDAVAAVGFGNLVSVMLGDGAGAFGPPTSYPTALKPHQIEIGDLDGDTDMDVAVYLKGARQIAVRPGNGDGTLGPETLLNALTSRDFEVTDMDGDGDDELVYEYRDDLYIEHGRPDGTFARRRFYRPRASDSIAVGDFDGDGVPDVCDGAVMLSTELGLPPLNEVLEDVYLTSIFLRDLNEDGFADIVSTNTNFEIIVRYGLGRADGEFGPATVLASGVLGEVEDFDADGTLDFLVIAGSDVQVWLGAGDGSFDPPIPLTLTTPLNWLDVVHADADGIPYLVTLDITSQIRGQAPFLMEADIGLLLGNGDGSFGPHQVFAAPTLFRNLAIGDADGDGLGDLVYFVSNTTGEFRLRRGNGDGTFGSEEFLANHPTLWDGQRDPRTLELVDLNGDQHADLLFTSLFSAFVGLGNGDGTFAPFEVFFIDGTQAIATDVDGDSILDLVGWSGFSQAMDLGVLYGVGDGTFGSLVQYPIPAVDAITGLSFYGYDTIRSGDIDGDGIQDFLVPLFGFFKSNTALSLVNLAGE